jgi:hypothetical protein
MDHNLAALIPDADPRADAYIGASKKTRANWRVKGIGPKFVRISNRIFYHPEDIAEWVNARRVQSTSQRIAA